MSKRTFTVLKLHERRPHALGGYEYLVQWAGYPPETQSWEPTAHISPLLVDAFDASCRSGEDPTPTEQERISATLAGLTSRELTQVERAMLLDSQCPVPKEWQSNTPNNGFFTRTWGVLVFNRSCVQVVDFEEVFGCESISSVVFALLRLLSDCPELLQQLRVIAYDDACHLLRFLELRRDVPQYDAIVRRTESRELAVCVDPAHFDYAHGEQDTYCRMYTNPHLPWIAALRHQQNSEAAEASNAWLSRFKLIVRQMTPGRFNFFLLCMCARRNMRIIMDFALTAPASKGREYSRGRPASWPTDTPPLLHQLVAHGLLPSVPDSVTALDIPRLRRRLLDRLLPSPPPIARAPACLAVVGHNTQW